MIKIENYPNALKEVYVILNNMSQEEVSKIPDEFMDMIKTNMNDEYIFELYDDISFEEQYLLQETKAILAYIFMNFWGTEEQKTKIKAKFEQDIIDEENSKQKYNPEDLFKKNKLNEENNELSTDKNVQLVEYKKDNVFMKIINKIRRLFKKDN